MKIPESVLTEYAKRRGISGEEARAMYATITNTADDNGFGAVRDFLGNFADLAELTRGLPEQAQQTIMPQLPILAMGAAGTSRSSGSEAIADAIRDIGMFREAMKALDAKDDDSMTKQSAYVDTLTAELNDIKSRLFEKQEDEKFGELKTFVTDVVKNLESQIGEVKKANGTASAEKKSAVKELVDQVHALEEAKDEFRKVGLLAAERPAPDIDDYKAELLKRGYQVKEPPGYEELERLIADHEQKWQTEWAKREQEVRAEVLQSEEAKARSTKMWIDLGTGVLDTIVSAATAQDTSGVTALSKFKDLVGTYAAAQAGGEGTGAEAVGAGLEAGGSG